MLKKALSVAAGAAALAAIVAPAANATVMGHAPHGIGNQTHGDTGQNGLVNLSNTNVNVPVSALNGIQALNNVNVPVCGNDVQVPVGLVPVGVQDVLPALGGANGLLHAAVLGSDSSSTTTSDVQNRGCAITNGNNWNGTASQS